MSITAVNATYLTGGPSASGQILVSSPASDAETALVYSGTVILDGSTTTFTLNFLDGTKTLSFTPSAVSAFIVGGTETTTPAVKTGTITSTGVTITLSGAGSSAATLKIAGTIYR